MQSAKYGPMQSQYDFTFTARGAFCIDESISIAANVCFNNIFGDVAPGVPKYLTIQMADDGVVITLPELRTKDYVLCCSQRALSQSYIHKHRERVQTSSLSKQKHHFVSFGNENFEQPLNRICNQAFESGYFDDVQGLNEKDLSPQFCSRFAEVLSRKKGGGYWIWKPFILRQKLRSMQENDILVYCDAGCTVSKWAREEFDRLITIVNSSEYGMLGFELTYKECAYTNEKVFQHFNIARDDTAIRQSNQIMATVIILRKCRHCETLIDEWERTLEEDCHLFTDNYNEFEKSPHFIDHRHDQSVFSVIRKLRGCVVVPDNTYATDWSTHMHIPFLATRFRS